MPCLSNNVQYPCNLTITDEHMYFLLTDFHVLEAFLCAVKKLSKFI